MRNYFLLYTSSPGSKWPFRWHSSGPRLIWRLTDVDHIPRADAGIHPTRWPAIRTWTVWEGRLSNHLGQPAERCDGRVVFCQPRRLRTMVTLPGSTSAPAMLRSLLNSSDIGPHPGDPHWAALYRHRIKEWLMADAADIELASPARAAS